MEPQSPYRQCLVGSFRASEGFGGHGGPERVTLARVAQRVCSGAGSPQLLPHPGVAFSVGGHLLSAYCVPAPSLTGQSSLAVEAQTEHGQRAWQGFREGCLKEASQTRSCESQAGTTSVCAWHKGVCALASQPEW